MIGQRVLTLLVMAALSMSHGIAKSPVHATMAKGATAYPDYQAIVKAYMLDYPSMSQSEALAAAEGQGKRWQLLERIGQSEDFGGSWYDPAQDVMHVSVVSEEMEAVVVVLAKALGVNVATERVPYRYSELELLASDVNRQREPEEAHNDVVFAAADGRWNRVAVAVTDGARAEAIRARFAGEPRVMVKEIPVTRNIGPTACTSRTACGTPARSGIVIGIDADGAGSGSATRRCSLGFTAAASDGSRWIVTAGHCSLGIVTSCPSATGCWGHGQRYFGPMRAAADTGNVDVGRIRKDNSYWGTGGYIYNAGNPNSPFDVDYALNFRTEIQVGDAVCQSMRHAVSGANCGTVVDVVSFRGMVEMSIDACQGDSGGGWFSVAVIGTQIQRYAYGIQSQADNPPNCHGAGEHAYFSAIPDINAHWDSTTAARLRLEIR